MNTGSILCSIAFFLFTGVAAGAETKVITLPEVLKKTADTSFDVAASRMKELAALHRASVAEAGYYPTVNLEAVESTGFPGSVAHLGIGGLVASPYRVGVAAGVVSTIPIWDFGRTSHAVAAAERDARVKEQDTKYLRYRAYQTGLQIFYECALYRTLKETWAELATGAKLVKEAVDGFVRTGQRSIVERYLVESQLENALTQISVFEEREKQEAKEIALLTGMPADTVVCPVLPAEEVARTFFSGTPEGNPLISRAEATTIAAKARVDEASAEYMPKLIGAVDVGVMQDHRLIDSNWYAVGVALVIPVFEGFSTVNKIKEASALVSASEKETEARRLEVAQTNIRFDKIIEADRTALTHLEEEFGLADRGYQLAKKRFYSMQGSVVDVRESFSNLTRAQTELIATKASYLQAIGAKAILNGTPF